ncbi:PAS domain S-box protein [Ferribacterium limneticum]|uniref:PAS domain S-box protein n=1 Tax=Ferribacterium limneticum TaxID=76259 RepID=UPI001CFC3DF4|nr:PAS domain S-box protein [Ferribacterium limneticum]UCV17728.1 PAS domain S-box protein [Ferribacterium limneticum]
MNSNLNIEFQTFFVSVFSLAAIILGCAILVISKFRRAKEEMRISKDFFQSTFDAAAVGMAVANIDGRYVKVNRAMCEFVGYSESELLRMSYREITFPEDIEANVQARQRLLAGEMSTFRQEKRYVRKDGQVVWAVMVVSQICDKSGLAIYTIGQMLDIDTLKRIEQSLRASQAGLAHAQRISRIGEWEWNIEEDSFEWSDEICHLFGIDRSQLPKTYKDIISNAYSDDRPLLEGALNRALQDHKMFTIDLRILLPTDGGLRFVCLRGEVVVDASGKPAKIRGTTQDITERKQTELALVESRQLLRELSLHQKNLLEEERKYIAHEIHDELGQRLTALKMDISLLRLRFGKDPELLEKLEDMRVLAEGTIGVVRNIASDLRPSALDLGLVPAIEWLAQDLEAHSDICCRLDLGNEEISMNDTQATVVFRVVQESLTNVARHAKASEVVIALSRGNGQLLLKIQDDGCGFDPSAVIQSRGFGLFGMRERALGLGGKLQIESAPARGTTVSIEFPFPMGAKV